jgi:hypothetical protein
MRNSTFLSFFTLCFLFLQQGLTQRILQVEDPKVVETLRFYEGQKITFRTKDSGKEWMTKKIKSILVEEGVVIVEDGFYHIDQITHVRTILRTRQLVGSAIMTFGTAWLGYGGIALLFGLPNVRPGDLLIGAAAVAIGYGIRLLSRRVYVMGKNGRLRLIDISFPTPAIP